MPMRTVCVGGCCKSLVEEWLRGSSSRREHERIRANATSRVCSFASLDQVCFDQPSSLALTSFSLQYSIRFPHSLARSVPITTRKRGILLFRFSLNSSSSFVLVRRERQPVTVTQNIKCRTTWADRTRVRYGGHGEVGKQRVCGNNIGSNSCAPRNCSQPYCRRSPPSVPRLSSSYRVEPQRSTHHGDSELRNQHLACYCYSATRLRALSTTLLSQ